MAEINFLPVCSACRAILDDHEINIEYIDGGEKVLPRCQIVPVVCPYCHRTFDAITIPTKLPFPAADKRPRARGEI